MPILPPADAAWEGAWQGILHSLIILRKKHDLSAVGTFRQMSERLQALVIRQDVFGKGAELICVRMMAVMERFAHGV